MDTDIELHLQIWKELKPHLAGGDVEAAADDFVHVLLEHGVDAEDIMSYALDSELKNALRGLVEDEHFDDEEEDEDEDEWGFDDSDGC